MPILQRKEPQVSQKHLQNHCRGFRQRYNQGVAIFHNQKETVPFVVMPMGQTIQVPIKGKGVLGESFDQNGEDYDVQER